MKYVWKDGTIVDAWMIDVEQVRYQGKYPDWVGKLIIQGKLTMHHLPHMIALNNNNHQITASHGDYIIKDSKGKVWTCRAGSFDANYQLWAGDYEYDTGRPISSTKSFFVESIVDHPDGSATINLDMDMDTLKYFASIGVKKVLLDYAQKTIKSADVNDQPNVYECGWPDETIKCPTCKCWKNG